MKASETSYFCVRTSNSLKPRAFVLRSLNCLNHSFFLATNCRKYSFCCLRAASFSYLRKLMRLSSISSYLRRTSFSPSISARSSYSGSCVITRGRHWTSWMFFCRVSLVMISPMKFQIWQPFSVPSRMKRPEGSTWKKLIPLTIRFCLVNQKAKVRLPFWPSLLIRPNENFPFSGLSSVVLQRAKKLPLLARTTLFWRLSLSSPTLVISIDLFLKRISQKATTKRTLIPRLVDSSSLTTAKRLLCQSQLILSTSSRTSTLLISRGSSLRSRLPTWITVAKWFFLMNFRSEIATQSPRSDTKISPFLACSLQARHLRSCRVSTLQRKSLVAATVVGLQSNSQHMTISHPPRIQATFCTWSALIRCCSSSARRTCRLNSSTLLTPRMITSCCRITARLRASSENWKQSKDCPECDLQVFILICSSTAQTMKFSRDAVDPPLEVTMMRSSGENLASEASTCGRKPLQSSLLPKQRCVPWGLQTARQLPRGEKTALLMVKSTGRESVGSALLALLSRWSSQLRYSWLPYRTTNWFRSCSSRLCQIFCSVVPQAGVEKGLSSACCSCSSINPRISLTVKHCRVWFLSNLKLFNLLKAARASAVVLQVMQRV